MEFYWLIDWLIDWRCGFFSKCIFEIAFLRRQIISIATSGRTRQRNIIRHRFPVHAHRQQRRRTIVGEASETTKMRELFLRVWITFHSRLWSRTAPRSTRPNDDVYAFFAHQFRFRTRVESDASSWRFSMWQADADMKTLSSLNTRIFFCFDRVELINR